MNGRGGGSIAVVLGGATAAAALALAATTATAQADTPPEPPPFLGEFPAFTGTPTTIFEIPGILQDAQGDVDLFPITGTSGIATANEFTSVLGIQNVGILSDESAGFIYAADAFQLSLPGTIGPASDAFFENDFAFDSISFAFHDLIGFPLAGYALDAEFSEIGAAFIFFTPFEDFAFPLYFAI